MPTAPVVLYRGSRRKAAIACLCGLGFLLVGWMMLNSDGNFRRLAEYYHVIGWVSIVLFGGFLPRALTWLFRPPLVSIDQLGFSIQQPLSTRRYRWADIGEVWAHYHGDFSWVVWKLRDRRARPWWRLSRKYDGVLSGMWDCPAEEIAWEMNRVRGGNV